MGDTMTEELDVTTRTRVIEGPGTLEQLGGEARRLGERALLVTDPGLVATGHVERAEEFLRAAGLEVVRWDETRSDPTTRDVERCAERAREFVPDLLIGLGGGSSIDVAKGANFLWKGGGVLGDYVGRGSGELDLAPLIAVPTTAGTGSEVQSFALVVEEDSHRKMACGHPAAAPCLAILDAELPLGLPPKVTACTGLDAIGHALEVCVSTRGNRVSRSLAFQSLTLSARAFTQVLREPEDLDARADMLRAASLAGRGIENAMLGAAHSMANPLSARFDLPHGQAVGTVLPLVVDFNRQEEGALKVYTEIAQISGLAEFGTSGDEATETLIENLYDFLEEAELPRGLAALGVTEADCAELAQAAAREWTAQFNPRPIEAQQFEELFRKGLKA